ncbi:MAG: hypothetical protein J5563_04135 [Clostridia bacterium]|nr:hypothetical protein [Clostridia bacterium]
MRDRQKINLRGDLTDINMLNVGKIAEPASLNRMAGAALNYLENNPDPKRNYECRFALYPSHIPYHVPFFPPNQYGYDVISLADTDLRMQHVWEAMRNMAGVDGPSEAELGVKRRATSYVGEDGCCYANPASVTGCEVDGVWMSPWGTSHHVLYLCDQFEKERDPSVLALIKKALDTLWSLTEKKSGMADFPYATSYRDGEWLMLGWAKEHKDNYVFIIEPLVRFYELSGDEEYKRRAIQIAEAFVNRMIETRKNLEIDPETGSFEMHTHLHTRCVLTGMAHLGYLTGDSRYIRYARRVFDFVLSRAPGFGWYAEYMPPERVSETCVVGDMMWAAYYLALSGELDIFEEMERNWRNYLRCTQFFVTPDIKDFLRLVNPDKSEKELVNAFRELKKLEGGFMAQVTWNDLTQRQYLMKDGQGNKMLYMMGCCPPSGMLALYYIWKASAVMRDGAVYINMSVTADTPYATLKSDYSSEDKLTAVAGIAGDYYLRVPEWTIYDEAEIYLNDIRLESEWDGPQCRYLKVKNVKAGNVIRLRYPLVRFTQKLSQTTSEGTRDYSFEWLGNSVLSVSPKAEYIDLFGRQRGFRPSRFSCSPRS